MDVHFLTTPRGARLRGRTAPRTAAALVAAAVAGLFLAGWLTGWRAFIVETASMGRTAPVGTVVVTRPLAPAGAGVGDVITFTPEGLKQTYTHRVIEVTGRGYRTAGDLTHTPDAWVITPDRVVGTASLVLPGVGWLVRLLPWLCCGLTLVWLLADRLRGSARQATWLAGGSLTVAASLAIVRPLLGGQLVSTVPMDGGAGMTIVPTGLLPARFTALDGATVTLMPGELGQIVTHQADEAGRYQLVSALWLPWWGWVIAIVLCAIPLALALLLPPVTESPRPPRGPRRRRRLPRLRLRRRTATGHDPAATNRRAQAPARARTVVAAAVSVLALTAGSSAATSASFSAAITHPGGTDTVRSRVFYTCLDGLTYFAGASSTRRGSLFGAWRLGDDWQVNAGNYVGTTAINQHGIYPGPVDFTNITQVREPDGACRSDAKKYGQTYVSSTSTSQIDTGGNAYLNRTTSGPGNLDRSTWSIWFRTTTTVGGPIMCAASGSDCVDQITFMDDAGHLCFGWNTYVICSDQTTTKTYNDGQWHNVIGQYTMNSSALLYVDGALVASDYTNAGSWGIARVLYPQFVHNDWALPAAYAASHPTTSRHFAADLQMAAVFGGNPDNGNAQLGPAEIKALYDAAKP